MAISHTLKINEAFSANAATWTSTATLTSVADRLYLFAAYWSGSTLRTFTSLVHNAGTNPLTFVKVGDITFDVIATPLARLVSGRALKPNASNAGTVTLTISGTASRAILVVSEFAGVDTSGTDGSGALLQNVTNNADAAASVATTLSSLSAADNRPWGAAAAGGAVTFTPDGNYVELADLGVESRELSTQWDDNGQDLTCTHTPSASQDLAAIAHEIVAAAGDTPINAEPGSYAVSGAVAGTAGAYLISGVPSAGAQPGVYTIAPEAATTEKAIPLVADQATYSLAGTVAETLRGLLLVAEVGAYAIAGAAATTVRDIEAIEAPGSYSVVGAAAATTKNVPIDGQAGAYAVSGAAAATLQGQVIGADPAAYAITGADATTVYTPGGGVVELNAEPASYALSGAAASTLQGHLESAAAGSYALTGAAASTLQGHLEATAAGAYTVTGFDATTAGGSGGGDPVHPLPSWTRAPISIGDTNAPVRISHTKAVIP